MKKFLNKAKDSLRNENQGNQQPGPESSSAPQGAASLGPPTSEDVIRYRWHWGTNLGSIFVLEKWLHNSMFPASSKGDSELDAVTAAVQEMGLDAARAKWEDHWRNALSDNDLQWLVKEARCTSIRLPIGYFTMGSEFCKGTPFEGVSGVYVNAWNAVKEMIAKARGYGIGVLIDLHALPGGANTDAHSGSCTGKAELWGKKKNIELTKSVLQKIATDVRGMPGVIGIQVVNEAVYDAKHMYEFYSQAIDTIGAVDGGMPVYVSDGWDLGRALGWTNGRGGKGNPVVVDTHRYFTFSEKDRSQSPREIIGRIGGELGELDGKEGSLCDRGEACCVVGEWSCVLDGQTWSRVQDHEKEGLVKQFGQAQSQKWQQRSGGSFFWTYKMDWMDGGEWGFAEQTKKGNIPPPAYLTLPAQEVKNRIQAANDRRGELGNNAKQGHEGYWNQTSPGQKFEHWRYGDGWELGYSDAMKFFGMRGEEGRDGGDKIGLLDIWVKKRLGESGQRGKFGWEWEQGFRAGVKGFYEVVEI